jgi:hypothetical protein
MNETARKTAWAAAGTAAAILALIIAAAALEPREPLQIVQSGRNVMSCRPAAIEVSGPIQAAGFTVEADVCTFPAK